LIANGSIIIVLLNSLALEKWTIIQSSV
jgi:hypothetical protein